MKERKAFNFYRSYYEVAKKLPKKHQLAFIMAVLDFQFEGKETPLNGITELAYLSQKHSLDRQLQGYKDGIKGGTPPKGSSNPPSKGNPNQDKEQEQVQEKGISIKSRLLSEIKDSDVSNPTYLKVTLMFHELFRQNLIDLNISTSTIDTARGAWIDYVRLMIDKDGVQMNEFREVYDFLKADHFWKSNILSTKKLRVQFQKLLIQSRTNGQTKQNTKGASVEQLAETFGKHFATDFDEWKRG